MIIDVAWESGNISGSIQPVSGKGNVHAVVGPDKANRQVQIRWQIGINVREHLIFTELARFADSAQSLTR